MNNFFWGASTSSHQVEGGNKNDWTEWEIKNADRLAHDVEVRGWNKSMTNIAMYLRDKNNYISGNACDHYHRYEEDFDLAKSLGHNAHRFSIEWSRIEPQEGVFDDREIEHYRNVILALKERGLEPFVTLYHWTVPFWFRDQGGWLSRRSSKYFERYVAKLADAYKDLDIQFWLTLNEPDIYPAHAYLKGEWPPEKRGIIHFYRATRNLMRAHKRAYCVLKTAMPGAQVGIAKNAVYFETPTASPWDRILCWGANKFWNFFFLDRTKTYHDFIGINYYFHNRIRGGAFNQNDNERRSDMGWELYPDGLERVLYIFWRRYKKPLYITENGLADGDDSRREQFLEEHIAALMRAKDSGVDVRGYLHWSLLDNFEWDKGFAPRFGLVAIDYASMTRRVRKSAFAYKVLIETHLHKKS